MFFQFIRAFPLALMILNAAAAPTLETALQDIGARQFEGTNIGAVDIFSAGLGDCGIENNDSQLVAAMSHVIFDSYPGATSDPSKNPICGKTVTASYEGKSVTVTITDRCPGCGTYDLDLTFAAYDQLANPSEGRISPVYWQFDD